MRKAWGYDEGLGVEWSGQGLPYEEGLGVEARSGQGLPYEEGLGV